MQREKHAKLDAHAEQLDEWIEAENLTLEEARERLSVSGCSVSRSALVAWWNGRQSRRLQEQLLGVVARAASHCRELERDLAAHPAPELETLIALHRVLVFKLSAQASATPALLRLVTDSLKRALEWARLHEKPDAAKLPGQKPRDPLSAQPVAREPEPPRAGLSDRSRPDTVRIIGREPDLP